MDSTARLHLLADDLPKAAWKPLHRPRASNVTDLVAPGNERMRWVEKLFDQIDQSLEWQSRETMAWRFSEEDNGLTIAPCPLEVVGGADDGESV